MDELFEIDRDEDVTGIDTREQALEALEFGKIIYLPQRTFEMTARERKFLDPSVVEQPRHHTGRARIIFEPDSGKLRKDKVDAETRRDVEAMVSRFSTWATDLVTDLLPRYAPALALGPTTFRPCARKAVQGLHVDSFFFVPTQGQRVLRLFTNVNPSGVPRVWQVGDTFEPFAKPYLGEIKRPIPGSGWVLERLGVTRGRRTAYDHAMRQLRNMAKRDTDFQKNSPRKMIDFPPGSTWIVFTDSRVHGAASGQFAFEQTFLLPSEAMREPALSPLRVLERLLDRPLV